MSKLNKYFNQYVSSKVIFGIDLLLSILTSVLILLSLSFLTGAAVFRSSFALWWLLGSIIGMVVGMLVFRCYKVVVRHTTLRDLLSFIFTLVIKIGFMWLAVSLTGPFSKLVVAALLCDLLLNLFLLIVVRLVMFLIHDIIKGRSKEIANLQRLFIYGTSEKSAAAVTRLQNSSHYKVIGFVSPDLKNKSFMISELPVYAFRSKTELESIMDEHAVQAVLFASEDDAKNESSGLIEYLAEKGYRTLLTPTIDEVVGNRVMRDRVRDVKIEDLLGREEIKINMDEIVNHFRDKTVMVTGAAGSIGSELCRQLATFGIKKLVLFDNAETPMHNLRLELEARFPQLDFVPIVGDVRHDYRLDYAFRDWHPQVVFHAAAYKHVPLMEENPCEAILVNVKGSVNVANKCLEYGTEEMVMISTDKAVNPTNIMGCSKRLAEIYVQSLGVAIQQGKVQGNTRFITTRFGNVLGSNGSVIPRFREQIANGGPVTVTHPDITRFFMTIPEACRLVMEAATMSTGNQIFVFDMGESVKIDTLARRMISLAGLKVGEDIDIEYTGLRPGEKLYEEVLSNKENTLPTSHDRILIAKVREYDYDEVIPVLEKLVELAHLVQIPDMVKLMKKTVPEFISKNSRFEEFDRKSEELGVRS